MSKKIILFSVFVLFTLVSFGVKQPVSYALQNSSHDTVKLRELGVNLFAPDTQPKISENQAIAIAKGVARSQADTAKSVVAEYWNVTNGSFKGFSPQALTKNPKLKDNVNNAVPTWIISFEGLTIHKRGPDSSQSAPHTELVVFVDASSGEPLGVLSYR